MPLLAGLCASLQSPLHFFPLALRCPDVLVIPRQVLLVAALSSSSYTVLPTPACAALPCCSSPCPALLPHALYSPAAPRPVALCCSSPYPCLLLVALPCLAAPRFALPCATRPVLLSAALSSSSYPVLPTLPCAALFCLAASRPPCLVLLALHCLTAPRPELLCCSSPCTALLLLLYCSSLCPAVLQLAQPPLVASLPALHCAPRPVLLSAALSSSSYPVLPTLPCAALFCLDAPRPALSCCSSPCTALLRLALP